ncbi:MAG: DUF2293 domain-containing protein [Candidatus Schekmanbacteria bacterium]|nr:DUF2293 domain-containing protein [Candidatus Schekmanbacteria bacterium]
MDETLTLSPTPHPRRFRAADGTTVEPPAGWELLPPGDAGLTRHVKESGPSWTIVEKRGRKLFSRGVWAPAGVIAAAQEALETRRATAAYARDRERAMARREREQNAYEDQFEREVFAFLRFSARYDELGRRLAAAVSAVATPVGSGTVGRTRRLSVAARAEAAVFAWLRHQTTGYESMRIARIRGRRREVRRELAELSRELLDAHRGDAPPHAPATCPLCTALGDARDNQAATVA